MQAVCSWAQSGGNGAALDPWLCWPQCGRGSAPPLPWDLLLSAKFPAPGPSQRAFPSSAHFPPVMFILLFSLALLACHVSPARTFSCPRSWNPSVPPTDDCHSTTGDVTFPPGISCPHHPTSPSIPWQRDVSGPCQLLALLFFCQKQTRGIARAFPHLCLKDPIPWPSNKLLHPSMWSVCASHHSSASERPLSFICPTF